MMGITMESAIGSNVLTGFIAPVAELPPEALVAAMGALVCGISGVVVARVFNNPRNTASRESTSEKDIATAEHKVIRLADFRKAA